MRIAVWHDAPPGGARRAMHELVTRLADRHVVDHFRLGWGEAAAVERQEAAAFPFRPRRPVRLAMHWNDWLTYLDLRSLAEVERRAAARTDAGGYDVTLATTLRTCQAPSILACLGTPSVYYLQDAPLRRLFEPWCRPSAAPLSPYERARHLVHAPSRAILDRAIRRRD